MTSHKRGSAANPRARTTYLASHRKAWYSGGVRVAARLGARLNDKRKGGRMRKIFAVAAVALLVGSGTALADPDVGCGWGTMAFKGSKGTAAKVLAGTTNGMLGNQ